MDTIKEQHIPTTTKKLYASNAIRLGTFLGGPLIAGYLIGENFKALGNAKKAKKSVIIGIVSTVLLFAILLVIPVHIVSKIPSFIIPLLYMLLADLITKKQQGEALELHKQNDGKFYSLWRATGLAVVSLIIILSVLFGYFYVVYQGSGNAVYNAEMTKFSDNEDKSLVFYNHIQTDSKSQLLKEVVTVDIPAWEENIAIVKTMDTIGGLDADLKKQNKLLLTYAQLRLQAFEVFKQSLIDDKNEYDRELNEIHEKIENVLGEINK